MNNYKRINNITGLVAFLAAFVVYAITVEPTASFWDCGEFISASYSLQVVHPPGAPLFLIIGRFFSLFAGDDVKMVAPLVNMVSVLASALCVMFTFWITTYFARKLVLKTTAEPNNSHLIAIMGSGLVAALALTFSDTFWFSAVEAEVYAASSFFTAITFWAILKWDEKADEKHADKWLVLIGYLIGLAVGVHLLNLLVIPAIVYVYFFRRYPDRINNKNIVLMGLLGVAILVFVQMGIIPGIPSVAAKFDKFFVNSLNAPFGSGAIFFLLLIIGATVWGLRYTAKKGKVLLNTFTLCFAFIIIGYSSYAMVVIRSLANPPIDMNNPEDPFNLVYYLNREQYGDRPLLYGPVFTAQPTGIEYTSKKYMRVGDRYEMVSQSFKYTFDDKDQMYFPRMYDIGDPSHADGYRRWTGLREKEKPKFKDNIEFFTDYQMGWMYWRYLMWNFSGRQNEEQGYIGPVDGNWLSGIPFVDEARLGPQSNLPDSYLQNKGRNMYFMIPFILGLIGLFVHIKFARGDSFILGILFLITGAALIVYLNPPPYEPRERDYVFVGSFQVFCSWIGLAVIAVFNWLNKRMAGVMAAGAATIACLVAPVLMASQNWDDHDRSGRYMAIDFARNYLESCPKNAILFTNGDNDTYPLWYAQNVEKLRTDVRVINYSLLGASEYADQLRLQTYESAPIKFTLKPEDYRTGTRDYVSVIEGNPRFDSRAYYELKDIMRFVASDNDADKQPGNDGELASYIPTKKMKITLDMDRFIKNGWEKPADTLSRVNELLFDFPGNGAYKNGLLLLDIIASNVNERPICFTTTTGADVYMNLMPYFELRGLVYRLVPYKTEAMGDNLYGRIDTDTLTKLLVNTYTWGGMEKGPFFVDDKATLVPDNVRIHFYRLAYALVQEGKKDQAIKVLDHCLKVIPNSNLPYNDNMGAYVQIYYMAGAKDKAEKLMDELAKDAQQRVRYYKQFKGKKAALVAGEKQRAQRVLQECIQLATQYGNTAKAKQLETMAN